MQNVPAIGQKIELATEVEFWAETGENEPERLDYRSDRWETFIVEAVTTYDDEDYFNADVKSVFWNGTTNLDIDFDDWRPVA